MMPAFDTFARKLVFYWLPVALYCLLIFVQSSFPTTDALPAFPWSDKAFHVAGYALLGGLFFRAYLRTGIPKQVLALLVISALSASIYGVSDEIHQHFVPSRTADPFDAVADAAGSVLGAVAAHLFYNRPQ